MTPLRSGRNLDKDLDLVQGAFVLASVLLVMIVLSAGFEYEYGVSSPFGAVPATLAILGIPLVVLFMPGPYRCLFFNRRARQTQWSLATALWIGMLFFYTWAYTKLEPLLFDSDLPAVLWKAVGLALLGPAWLYGLLLLVARGRRRQEFERLEKEEEEARSRFAEAVRESLADGPEVDLKLDTASWEYRWRGPAWTVWACGVLGLIVSVAVDFPVGAEHLDDLLLMVAVMVTGIGFLLILLTRHPRSTIWKSRWWTRSSGLYRVLHPLVFCMVCVTTLDITSGILLNVSLIHVLSFIPFELFAALSLMLLLLPLAYVFWLTQDIRPLRPMLWLATLWQWATDLWTSLGQGNNSREAHP